MYDTEKEKNTYIYPLKRELEEKLLEVVRVTKVVQGGKIISFRAIVAVGNKKGLVGIGVGRASDYGSAVNKAILNGKKNICNILLTKSLSIPSLFCETFSASKIILIPAKIGAGIVAGGSPKVILEMAGVTNVICKQLGSPNILNNARATLNALIKMKKKANVLSLLMTKKNYRYLKFLKS